MKPQRSVGNGGAFLVSEGTNRLGRRSGGEGGEDPDRFHSEHKSTIKQIG
jgi:glutamate synthase domain-containing protein 2